MHVARLMLLTVVQGTAQGVSVFAQTREKLERTLDISLHYYTLLGDVGLG